MDNDLPAPNPPATNNVEAYLAMLAGVEDLPMPSTINNNVEYYLRYLVENGGGGGGGTTNYNQLSNKPKINSTTLSGNKSLDDLGIQAKIDAEHKLSADNVDDTSTTNKFVTASDKTAWNAKQDALTAGTGIAIINNVISSTLEGIDYEVDQELPATGEKGIIYLIPNGSSEQENIYDEYIWIPPLQEGESGRFEFIGTTQTDLTNYVDLTSAQTISGNKTFSGTLYALGNLSDGTNSIAVNKIANKDNFVTLSQAEYDALATKDPDTFYFIEEE